MLITIVFDCYAKIIECNNSNLPEISVLTKEFHEWLYEDSIEDEGCLCVKESLNLEILDVSVVLRFLNENYPECNARVVGQSITVESVDKALPTINL